jgi:hypothetical protein
MYYVGHILNSQKAQGLLIMEAANRPALTKGLSMVDFRQRRNSNTLVIGLLVFILAMVITFSDVYGLERFDFGSPGDDFDRNTDDETEQNILNRQEIEYLSYEEFRDPVLPTNADPPAIPEPTTLTLLALGCGALLVTKRKASS